MHSLLTILGHRDEHKKALALPVFGANLAQTAIFHLKSIFIPYKLYFTSVQKLNIFVHYFSTFLIELG